MVTMKQIADAAGVSRSTVSFILNDSYKPGVNIPQSTRQRVKSVAEKLGYHRNEMAVAMITGQTKVIGFCATDLKSEYISRTLEGVLKKAQSRGYFVKLFTATKDTSKTLGAIIGQRPAGIITWSPSAGLLSGLHDYHGRYKIPVVLTGSFTHCKWAGGVTSDDAAGSGLAVKHLLNFGHKNILHVSQGRKQPFAELRWKGFQQALRLENIPCGTNKLLEAETETILAEKLLERFAAGPKPTAICCASDMLAMQTLRILNSMGLKVPTDVSVVGFADLKMAEYATPALTTIAQPFEKIGQTAADTLLDIIQNKKTKNRSTRIKVKLIKRYSTSKC